MAFQFDPSTATPADDNKFSFDASTATEVKPTSIARKAGDLGLSLAKSVIAVPEMAVGLADIATGGRAGKFLENADGAIGFRPKQAKDILSGWQSDDLQGKQQQFSNADGIVDKLGVAVSNPSLLTNVLAESAAPMLAGGAIGRGAMALAPRLGGTAAGAIGEGAAMAGSQAEAIRQQTADGLMTPEQSALAAGTGLAGGAISRLSGGLSNKLGIGDVDTMLAAGTRQVAVSGQKNALRRGAEGFVTEGFLEELPQSLSEQALQNIALGKDASEGMADAAVMGTLAGGVMGAGAGALTRQQAAAAANGAPAQPEGWTTSPGVYQAPDPSVPPPEAPGFTTSPGAAPERTGGMDYQRDISTDGLSLVDAAAQDRERAATLDFDQADTTPGWDTSPGAAPPRVDGIDMGREFDTSGLELDNRLPSERMGINPNAGPLSRAATIAVDSAPAQEATFIGRTDRDLQAYQPKTGIEQGGPVNRILAAKMARDAGPGNEVVAVEGGYTVQKTASNQPRLPAPLSQNAINNGAANVQDTAPAAAPQNQAAPTQAPEAARGDVPTQAAAVPAAGTGDVQAAGLTYEQRNADRVARAERASTQDGWDDITAEENADAERDFSGTDRLKMAVNARRLAVKPDNGAFPAMNPGPTDAENKARWKQEGTYSPTTTGSASEPQANQTQQAAPQRQEAPAEPGPAVAGAAPDRTSRIETTLANGGHIVGNELRMANGMTQMKLTPDELAAAPATAKRARPDPEQARTPQPAHPAPAVERNPNWRKNAIQAGRVAKSLGIDPKGKRLAQMVEEIDAADSAQNQAPAPATPAQSATKTVAPSDALPSAAEQRQAFKESEAKRTAPGHRMRANAHEANPLRAFLAKHGVAMDLRNEFAPGVAEQRRAMVPGYGPIFRKAGLQMDALAERAVEEGFLTEADDAGMHNLIGRAMRGERVIPQFAPGVAETEMESRVARQREMEEDSAPDAVAGLTDASIFDLEDANIPWDAPVSTSTTEQFLRAMGASEQEIQDALIQESQGAQEGASRSGGPEQVATGQAPRDPASRNEEARLGRDGTGLTAPTRDDVLAQQERAENAARAEKAQQRAQDEIARRERERKDIARASDAAADTFVLGGDAEQNLSGQGGMFDEPTPQAAASAPAAKAKKPSAAQTRAKADLMNALADLGDILGKSTRMNILPEQEQKLLPVLTRVLDAAFRLGYAKFKDSAKFALDQIRAHLGDDAADALTLDHLQGAYIAMAGGKQGADTKRAVIDIETKAEIEAHTPADPEAADEGGTAQDAKTLAESLHQAIESGNMPKDNPALKKLVEAFDGKPADQSRMKDAQEQLETAIAMSARKVVARNEGDRTTFDILLRMYGSQPSLNIRTSTSITNQAYSTPAPLSFLASRLAGITRSTVAHEPTAGTGMLLIGADPKKALVNELNDLRISALKAQGFAPTQKDAATQLLVPEGTQPDAVVTNPPFGSIKDADGKTVKVKVDGFSIGQIDHLIAARALETMKDDGKATLILGANKVAGGLSTDDRIFFNWLYSHYNVTGHFEVNGDLYTRQGAGWPVRVIVINGRQRSSAFSPVAGTIQRADNWNQVYEHFTTALESAKQAPNRTGGIAPSAVSAPAAPGGRRPQSSTGSTGNVAGTGPRVAPDRAERAPEQLGGSRDEQRLNAEPYVPQPQPGQSPVGEARPAKPAGDAALEASESAKGNEFQLPYTPRSARKDEGVLIPANMAQPTQDALSRLEDDVGDIDEFARNELGYDTVADLHNALMGLQVDSVAMSIHQIKSGKAVVIADQTGIGKGRQAASIIRWAARHGMTPVFISVKPSLFTDMYGDLADIGTNDVTPFIMNGDAWVAGEGGGKLFANKPSGHKGVIQSIADSGRLPDGSNALFMTYSQINVANVQRQALMALAPNAVFVLDESHNAAGASATGEFMIGALDAAKGVAYLSATYAKRPDNMPLYFKTDIGDAAADAEGLSEAMAAGGLPLQTVVSNNLVKAGQMFRRERSYDGVSIASTFDTPNRDLHERMSNEATKALRAIVAADTMFHEVYVKALSEELAAQGASVKDNAGNQAAAGVQHTEFSSVVHNFVKQMLLGLKAQSAADEAIASLKRGEKPIIAVENTMGSFLTEYAAANGIGQGDSLGSFDYRTVLTRALERTRVLTEKKATGDEVKRAIPLSELDAITRTAYDHARDVIDSLKLNIPVSPIDWMRAEIQRAGFSVAEITGRNLTADYSDSKKPVLSAIDADEQKDKVNTTRLFNSGKLDALILNVAGSTGISLHASEKFEDQRQRHMIVAQAAGDINIFMQMLGRVHRTGQVRLPKYTILSVDLPTEKRPTAVLSIKMKSLNANTSSNTESATSVKSSDILNKYGDQIVNQYLVDNYALARALGLEGSIGSDPTEDIARKATGRLALQPIATQHAFYDEVEGQYTALIDYLNKTNQNDLEPRTFDFDAKETRQEVLFEGPNHATPFGEDAIYGEYSIKAQGTPMTPEEIRATMAEHLAELSPAAYTQKMLDELDAKFNAYYATLEDAGKEGASSVRNIGRYFLSSHKIGTTFRVDINSEPLNAVVVNVRNAHKETGNPFSLSKIQVTVAVNGALRSLSVPATQFRKIEVSGIAPTFKIEQLFKEQPPNQRETAKIVTGNLLAAYGELQGVRGTIITFSKQDGTSEQGILLPKLFDYSKNTRGDYHLEDGAAALKFLQESDNKDIGRFGIMSRDGAVRVLPAGQGVRVQVPKSKLKGGKYFLDKGLIEAGGDFVSQGSFMVLTAPQKTDATKVLDLLMKKQALYALPSMAEEARALTGEAKPAFSRSAGEDGKSSVLSKNGKFKGWPKFNAWTRAEYNDVVSLLPADYRNDPHRREPLSPADRDARAAAALPQLDQLNAGLPKRTFTVDQLGNIAVDARNVGVLELQAAAEIADQHGLGIYVTGVQFGQIKLLQAAGFVSEAGLGAVLQRAARTNSAPMPTPSTTMGAPAYGTIMSYKPRGFSQVMFSFGGQDATRTPARKASDANLVATQQLVDGLKANWTNAPEIIVARNMQDGQIPQSVRDYDQTLKSQGATGEARGFIYQGKVYLLADQLNGPHQIAEVLFHEVLGHYGLRRAFGKGLTPILQQVATMRRKEMLAKAKEYGLDLTNERDRLTAAEEILAEMAQATPEIGFVKRAIAVIRNWMRANVPGFQSLRLTDNDIIQKFLLPARGAVTRSKETGAQSLERAMAAFSRTPGDQTQTEAFKRWFAGSRVVDAQGKPLLVYHGTAADFDAFDKKKSGAVWSSDKEGFFFSSESATASEYADFASSQTGGGANVMPVYVSLKNPLTLEKFAEITNGIRLRQRHGDGADALTRFFDEERDLLVRYAKQEKNDGILLEKDGKKLVVAFRPEQIKSAIGNNGDFGPTNPDIRFSRANGASAWDAPEPSRFDALAYKVQDKHIDTKRVVESITKTVGQIKDSLNVYLQEELYHGRAARRVADFGGSELKPLLNQMRMAGLSLDDVEEYLHARHAKEANALIASREPGMPDGGSGMTNKAADDYMRNLPADQKRKLEAVAKKVDAITASTRQLYADYGLEDQKTVDGWGAMFANYVPLMREGKDGGMGIGQGFTVKGKEVKGRTGSTRKVVDILANIAAQREKVIVRGEKNRVATALVGLAAANPNPEFWEARSQPPTERVYDAKTDSVVERPDSMFKQRANVVTAKVKDAKGNVTEQAVVFNEDDPRAMRMAAALKNLDAANLEGLLGVSAKITRYFSAVNTKYNPVFGIVNLVRDVQGAMVNLAATPLAGQQGKIAKDTISALASIYQDVRAERSGKQATSKWSKLWAQMQEDGGTTGYRDLFATSADRADSLKNIIDPTAWADGPWGKVFTANGTLKVPLTIAKQKAGVLFDWLSDYNDAMENGVRLAVYKAALDKGMSREQAASMAKNLTVNFNRKGQIGQQAGALYAFFNAAMQGTARIGQTLFDMDGGNVKTLRLSKTGKAVVYGGVTLGAIQALMLAGAGFDDEDPPEFVRERSLIIPTGGKTYVSIPMPLGLHVIPGIGRHATEFALSGFDKPAKRVVSMLGMLADAFNPIGNSGLSIQTIAPTVIDPLVALTENRDWTGKPIARVSSNKAIPGHSQWKDTATSMSKVIAEAVNWVSGGDEYVAGAFSPTPDQIDYLIAQVTGGVGRELSKVEQAGKAALSGEELPTYKMPLLGRFYGNSEGQASEGAAFYANVDKLNEIETKVKAMRKDGKMAEASEYLRSKPEAVLIFQVNAAERRIQQLKRDKRELIEQDASREQVRAKEVQITEVMARLNRAAEAKSL